MTARLRIGCSTTELLWRNSANALERTRTAMPFGTTPSRWRVYQFHHQGASLSFDISKRTGPTGLEPATSRVTVECSNQTELRHQQLESGLKTLSPSWIIHLKPDCQPRLVRPQ